MKNKVFLDMTQPEIAEAFTDCEVGDTKTVSMTITVDSKDETELTATVNEVEYVEESPAEEVEAPEDAAAPVKPGKSKEIPNAVMMVIKPK